MYAILICVFSKKVNVCNFRDMWKKNNSLLNQALFFTFTEMCTCILIEDLVVFMYLEV